MQKRMSEKKRFSIIARGRSVKHAVRGLKIILKTQHNAWVHTFFAILAVFLGFYFHISLGEWSAIILSITSVFVAEAFNTAMEIDIDLTSPTYHPYARDTKDVAAGAVLLTIIGSLVLGLIIFLPKFFN